MSHHSNPSRSRRSKRRSSFDDGLLAKGRTARYVEEKLVDEKTGELHSSNVERLAHDFLGQREFLTFLKRVA